MRKTLRFTAATLGAAALIGATAATSSAGGRASSIRVGGTGSSGAGSHYVGGAYSNGGGPGSGGSLYSYPETQLTYEQLSYNDTTVRGRLTPYQGQSVGFNANAPQDFGRVPVQLWTFPAGGTQWVQLSSTVLVNAQGYNFSVPAPKVTGPTSFALLTPRGEDGTWNTAMAAFTIKPNSATLFPVTASIAPLTAMLNAPHPYAPNSYGCVNAPATAGISCADGKTLDGWGPMGSLTGSTKTSTGYTVAASFAGAGYSGGSALASIAGVRVDLQMQSTASGSWVTIASTTTSGSGVVKLAPASVPFGALVRLYTPGTNLLAEDWSETCVALPMGLYSTRLLTSAGIKY